jgi:cystathionine beta-lyase family protein involved in aluminum resistance
VDRIIILVFSITFSCALLVAATYAAAWLAPYLSQMPAYWSMVMLAAVGMIAGAAAIWRRHRNSGLRASR